MDANNVAYLSGDNPSSRTCSNYPSAKKCSLIDAVEMSSVTDKDNIIKSFKLLAWQIIDPIIYGVISN
ncbi:MAG TPA: hypothetical protein VFD60_14605 [Nitrososphaeraceae archaeon]|nr:hypothetical protein [Nitrososphaeraceae archaeon]